jgi:hypothetical protein
MERGWRPPGPLPRHPLAPLARILISRRRGRQTMWQRSTAKLRHRPTTGGEAKSSR